jgi:uncharacterized membrane protein YdbT with pleckstrin-like domain
MSLEAPLISIRPTRLARLKDYVLAALLLVVVAYVQLSGIQAANLAVYSAIGLAVLFVVLAEIGRYGSHYAITGSQIVVHEGIVGKHRRSLFLNSVTDVTARQSRLEAVLGFGTVIAGSESGTQHMQLKMKVKKPRDFAKRLEHLIKEYKHSLTRPHSS